MVSTTPLFPRPAAATARPGSANQIWGWRGLRWEKTKTARFHTITQMATTGRSARTAGYSAGLYDFDLVWEVLRDDRTAIAPVMPVFPKNELKVLAGFYAARKGALEAFGIFDPYDQATTAEVLSPSTPAPGEDLTNPDSTVYQAVRTYGGTTEPVGLINEGTDGAPAPVVYVFGSPVGFTPNSPRDGWFTLDLAPPPGALLTADFHYYFRVVFADTMDFATSGLEFYDAKAKLTGVR